MYRRIRLTAATATDTASRDHQLQLRRAAYQPLDRPERHTPIDVNPRCHGLAHTARDRSMREPLEMQPKTRVLRPDAV
jgi:hypothetical protein